MDTTNDVRLELSRLREENTELSRKLDIIEQCVDGVWDWRISTGVAYLSPKWKESLGYEPDELDNTYDTFERLLMPGEARRAQVAIQAHLDEDEAYDILLQFRKKDGDVAWIRARGIAITGPDGKLSRMIGTHSDVSRPLTDALAAILESAAGADTGVLISMRDGRIGWFNDAAERILGATLTGRQCGEVTEEPMVFEVDGKTPIPPERFPMVKALQGEFVNDQICLKIPGREEMSLLRITARPIVIWGDHTGGVAVIRDATQITNLAEAVERLEESETQLRRSNEDLQSFALVASHDLREPLRTISSYARILDDSLGDTLDAKQRKCLDFVMRGADRMSTLVESLLTYSRVGSAPCSAKPVDLNDVARQSRENLERAIEESGACLEVATLPTVRGDTTLLVQLFDNLVMNSIRFRSDDAPVIRISSESDEDGFSIYFDDNGPGIPEDKRESVFMMFDRAQLPNSKSGAGVGLAIVQRIMDRHGGTIRIEENPCGGARFVARFCT